MEIEIRKAEDRDTEDILRLLRQVNLIHHNGRPDLFKIATKYTAEQLKAMIADKNRPILVADDGGRVVGYAFCIYQPHDGDVMLTPITTLYLDDLCVDEACRRRHVGKTLYNAVVELAKNSGCHNITLNAWTLNRDAIKFYESLGMTPLKICMEQIIDRRY